MKYMSLKFNYFASRKQYNIPQNQPSTHLNIAHNYIIIWVFKRRKKYMFLHGRLLTLFNEMAPQMKI